MAFKDFAIALAGPEAERVAAGRRESRTMDALGRYMTGDEVALGDVYKNNPEAGFKAEGLVQDRQDKMRQSVGNMVRYLDEQPPENKAQAYAAIVPQLKRAFPGQPVPEAWSPEVEQALVQVRTLAAGGANREGAPAAMQVFEAQVRAAGLTPGSPKYQEAAQIALGLEGRASGAAIAYKVIKGADGRERLVAVDPREPGAIVMDGQTGSFGAPQAAPASQPTTQPERTYTAQFAPGEEADPFAQLPEQEQQLAMRLTESGLQFTVQNGRVVPGGAAPQPGFGANGAPPVAQPQPVATGGPVAPPAPMPAPANAVGGGPIAPFAGSGRGAFVGRSPEEDAAAVEAARIQAGLNYAPQVADAAADAARKKSEAEALATRNATADKRNTQAAETVATLTDVIQLLPSATGSTLGALRDAALAVGGLSTPGAQASSQLRLLAAKLIANVPRFEGPQSNIDVQFYRESAGDLANERLPTETRLAAARKMMEIAKRYADSGQAPADDEEALIGKYL